MIEEARHHNLSWRIQLMNTEIQKFSWEMQCSPALEIQIIPDDHDRGSWEQQSHENTMKRQKRYKNYWWPARDETQLSWSVLEVLGWSWLWIWTMIKKKAYAACQKRQKEILRWQKRKKDAKTKADDNKLPHLSGNNGSTGDHYGRSFIRRPDYWCSFTPPSPFYNAFVFLSVFVSVFLYFLLRMVLAKQRVKGWRWWHVISAEAM